jgi:hypothetical protein
VAAFPKQFLWGAATGAHQVEGNNTNSDNWVLEHVPGTTYVEPSVTPAITTGSIVRISRHLPNSASTPIASQSSGRVSSQKQAKYPKQFCDITPICWLPATNRV